MPMRASGVSSAVESHFGVPYWCAKVLPPHLSQRARLVIPILASHFCATASNTLGRCDCLRWAVCYPTDAFAKRYPGSADTEIGATPRVGTNPRHAASVLR